MNYSKVTLVIKIAGYIAGFVGFFLMVGSVGSSDLAVELGIYEPWYAHLGTMIAGLVLLGIAVLISAMFYEDDYDDEYEESEEEFDD